MTADPVSGTIAPGQSQAITVKYDVSQNEFQGTYSAEILLTTNAQPLAKVNCCLSSRETSKELPHVSGVVLWHLSISRLESQWIARNVRIYYMQVLTATAYVFCAALQSVTPTSSHSISVNYTVVQDSRPTTSDWPPVAPTGFKAYVTAIVQ